MTNDSMSIVAALAENGAEHVGAVVRGEASALSGEGNTSRTGGDVGQPFSKSASGVLEGVGDFKNELPGDIGAPAAVTPRAAVAVEASFDDFTDMLSRDSLFHVESGRFYCALSLAEAETLRGIIHARGDAPLVADFPSASVALRVLSPGGELARLLDYSAGHPASPRPYQADIARNCFRFMDSQVHYTEPELSLLIQAVQSNDCEHRAKWWADVRARRRRDQGPWNARPVAEIFKVDGFVDLLLRRATTFRIAMVRARAHAYWPVCGC